MHVLLVEDDVRLAQALGQILKQNGYQLDMAHNGLDGYEYALSGIYDVIILDLMLPKMDGFEVASKLRRNNVSTPILMLTARDAIPDKIKGLDSGADDYMTKPFSPAELMAHLRALTRRRGQVTFETLNFEGLTLNLETYELSCGGKSIRLGSKEFDLIKLFMSNPLQIISKETIITKVWGYDSDIEENNVEAYISFLRKKLRFLETEAAIETVRRAGYRLMKAE